MINIVVSIIIRGQKFATLFYSILCLPDFNSFSMVVMKSSNRKVLLVIFIIYKLNTMLYKWWASSTYPFKNVRLMSLNNIVTTF